MIVFLLKLSELGSDRSQDDAVCRRRLFIFLDQDNISKSAAALKLVINADGFSEYFEY